MGSIDLFGYRVAVEGGLLDPVLDDRKIMELGTINI